MMKHCHLWTLTVLLVCCGCLLSSMAQVAPAGRDKPPFTKFVAPMVYDPVMTPVPLVEIRLDDSEPLLFMVDTGFSSTLLLDKKIADRLHIRSSATIEKVSPGNVTTYKASVKTARLLCQEDSPDLIYHLPFILVGDFSFFDSEFGNLPIAGVIGLPLLARYCVQIDYAGQQLTLATKASEIVSKSQDQASKWMPMHFIDPGYSFRVLLNERLPIDLMIDTGSNGTSITDLHTARHLYSLATSHAAQKTLAGWDSATSMLLPSIRIGDLVEPNPHIIVPDHPQAPLDSHIGNDLLSRFRVTLDFPNKRILLERADDYQTHLCLPGQADVLVNRKADQWIVEHVAAESPALQAGLQAGVRLVSVDSKEVAELPRAVVQNLLSGRAETQTDLGIVGADGATQHIRYQRRSEFLQKPIIGVGIETITEKKFKFIRSVLPHSPAAEAGLREEDQIMELDGISIQSLGEKKFNAIFDKAVGSVIRMTIRRKGEHQTRKVKLTVQELF